MARRRFLVAGILAGGLLLGASPCHAGDRERKEPAKPWDDPALVTRRFSEACEAVEKICGAPFERRPTVRFSAWAGRYAARFDAEANEVHVSTEAHNDFLEAESWLRLVFVHEATHAWDAAHFSWRIRLERGEIDKEAGAVLEDLEEGHAHHVTARAAQRWGIEAEFREFEKGYVAEVTEQSVWLHAPGPARSPFRTLDTPFQFLTGRAFIAAVEAAEGAGGLERVFRSPPRRVRAIELPSLWLAGKEPPADAVADRALAAMRSEFPSGEGWDLRAGDVLPEAVRADVLFLPAERREALAAGFESGRGVAAYGSEGCRVVGAVRRFRDEAAAKGFARGWKDSTDALIREGPAIWRMEWAPRDSDPENRRVDSIWNGPKGAVGCLEFERVGRYVLHVARSSDPPYRSMATVALTMARRALLAESAHSPPDAPR